MGILDYFECLKFLTAKITYLLNLTIKNRNIDDLIYEAIKQHKEKRSIVKFTTQ